MAQNRRQLFSGGSALYSRTLLSGAAERIKSREDQEWRQSGAARPLPDDAATPKARLDLNAEAPTWRDASAFAPLRHHAQDAMRAAIHDDALVVHNDVVIVRILRHFVVSV